MQFWSLVSNEFDCMNASESAYAYESMKSGVALRFHKKDSFIPNIEFKPLKTAFDRYTLEKRLEVECNGKILYLSPLELQVAFKLQLGSDKDKEDARFLFKLFKEHLNRSLLKELLKKLYVSNKEFRDVIGEEIE